MNLNIPINIIQTTIDSRNSHYHEQLTLAPCFEIYGKKERREGLTARRQQLHWSTDGYC